MSTSQRQQYGCIIMIYFLLATVKKGGSGYDMIYINIFFRFAPEIETYYCTHTCDEMVWVAQQLGVFDSCFIHKAG